MPVISPLKMYALPLFGQYARAFVNYLNELRLTRAAMLLTTTDTPVIEIAGMSGFNNISNFNRAFKMYYETTPSKYRRAEKQSF